MKNLNTFLFFALTLGLIHKSNSTVFFKNELFYDSELNDFKPFKYKRDTSKYKLEKANIRLLNKNIKDKKLKSHIWDILQVISIYTLLNDDKYSTGPRYLKLASKDLKSKLLVEKIDNLVKLPLYKNGFNKYIKDIYKLNKEDIENSKKVNIFDNSTKRKDRLKELEQHLKDSLKMKKGDIDEKKLIQIDRKLDEDNEDSIENILTDKMAKKTYKQQNAPVERFLKLKQHKRKHKHRLHRQSRFRKNRKRYIRRNSYRKPHHKKSHKKTHTRKLTTKLINPVHHHHHRKAFGIPGAPGGGGGVTQGPGVENLKVVINAIGQPSTYLPVEQNDSYKKGYKEADAAPKVIVTRLKLPGRIGQ
jgi:hypothetical protein